MEVDIQTFILVQLLERKTNFGFYSSFLLPLLDYKQIWTKWVPYALEPYNSGRIYGGSSGNIWEYVIRLFFMSNRH